MRSCWSNTTARGLLSLAVAGAVLLTSGPSAAALDNHKHHSTTPAVHAAQRPNVVLVEADDMRVDDLRFAPRIRHLIGDRGVTFENSFSPYPLCCPARASLLTGLYAHNHHVFSHEAPYGFASFDDSYTVATAMRQAGYNTGFIGKYLNGYGVAPSLVTGRPSWNYVPRGWTDWEGAVERGPGSPATGGTYNYFDTSFNVNGHIDNSHKGHYQTNVIGSMARGMVRRFHASPKPFFTYLSFVAPHHGAPYEPGDPTRVPHMMSTGTVDEGELGLIDFETPARPAWVKGRFDDVLTHSPGLPEDGGPSEADMSDKPAFLRDATELDDAERAAELNVARQRAEAVYVLDQEVGRLIGELKRLHEYDNTVLIFTSDNGYFLGEHRIRQGKVKPYEPSLRVPFLIAGPGMPHGQRRYDPIMTPDITATVTALGHAGRFLAAHHSPDGTSKLPTIRYGDRGWRTAVVTEAMFFQPGKSVKNAALGFDDARDEIGIRTARYKYIKYADGESELYDLAADGNELSSVVDDPAYAKVQAELEAAWGSYKDCGGGTCQVPLAAALRESPTQEREATRAEDRERNALYGVMPR